MAAAAGTTDPAVAAAAAAATVTNVRRGRPELLRDVMMRDLQGPRGVVPIGAGFQGALSLAVGPDVRAGSATWTAAGPRDAPHRVRRPVRH
ncbi:hypothetical protein GCM10009716_32550 [Streptomyces sodiiphilus]|uniref:Uncharacterized protein n=1 Tax=Streptomyces sodiiphilus TaxID=226217 RepID=A0ABN2PGQ7_9ACTN